MRKIVIIHLGQGIKRVEEELNNLISEDPELEIIDIISMPRVDGHGLPNHYAVVQTMEETQA